MDRQMHRYMDVHTDVRTYRRTCGWTDGQNALYSTGHRPSGPLPSSHLLQSMNQKEQGQGTADPYCPWTTGCFINYLKRLLSKQLGLTLHV